jgi:substrate import-associated zinc metallohydrolase lipoprotein
MILFNSCRTEETIDPDIDIPNLGGYEYPRTALDDWLDETFLLPYNIEVIYRWDAVRIYSSISKKITPVRVEKVQPMLSALSKVWFEPFQLAAPYGFLQKHTPKTIVLAGSPEYAADGNSMVLGTAEGAMRVLLTNVNAFDPHSESILKEYLHVIEHEYVHILNQSVDFSTEFKGLTRQFYDPTGWTDYDSDNEAYERGFLSRYSMTAPDEDFAEIVSLVLVKGIDWFENTVIPVAESSTVNPNAASALRRKVAIAEEYYKTAWEITLFDDPVTGKKGLATLVREAVDYVVYNSDN